MSDVRDPETDQRLPVPNEQTSCQDLVIADIEKRKALGLRKYGTLLQPFNGRSFLQDAYEEVLDLAVYLRGKLEEERQTDENTLVQHLAEQPDEPLWEEWNGIICSCIDPVPAYTGYNFPVCAKCVGKVPDSKLAHKQ